MTSERPAKFRKVLLPTGGFAYLPDDINIRFPVGTGVSDERLHLLAYIPWQAKYLDRVPEAYRDFFSRVLPLLGARTTNVHTAICLPFLDALIASTDAPVHEHALWVALMLHDSGWSLVSHEDIADSLSYSGLVHEWVGTEVAQSAKRKHDILGSQIARRVVGSYSFKPELSEVDKDYICALVRHHTAPWDYPAGVIPVELQLLSDADRLWSYSHENFWQDTVRKNVEPQAYARNLAMAIEGCFLTEAARVMARAMLLDREAEVAELYFQPDKAGDLIGNTAAVA